MPTHSDFKEKLSTLQREVEAGIRQWVPSATTRPERVHQAMRYSLEAGGKRLRPMLVLAAAELGQARSLALAAAIAIECVHTYSLIHDDLPAMDNDDLRRGRPTCHRHFDEATAILAGDALLTLAFDILARGYSDNPPLLAALVRELANAAGSRRLIGGQMEDILAEKQGGGDTETLDFIHRNKTGAMIEVSLVFGGLCAGMPTRAIDQLREAGREIGMAFQIIDDVLDATTTSEKLGKTAGKDARDGKTTYVSHYGLESSRTRARKHTEAARSTLEGLPGDPTFLLALTSRMLNRES